jgi:hypothetical protein
MPADIIKLNKELFNEDQEGEPVYVFVLAHGGYDKDYKKVKIDDKILLSTACNYIRAVGGFILEPVFKYISRLNKEGELDKLWASGSRKFENDINKLDLVQEYTFNYGETDNLALTFNNDDLLNWGIYILNNNTGAWERQKAKYHVSEYKNVRVTETSPGIPTEYLHLSDIVEFFKSKKLNARIIVGSCRVSGSPSNYKIHRRGYASFREAEQKKYPYQVKDSAEFEADKIPEIFKSLRIDDIDADIDAIETKMKNVAIGEKKPTRKRKRSTSADSKKTRKRQMGNDQTKDSKTNGSKKTKDSKTKGSKTKDSKKTKGSTKKNRRITRAGQNKLLNSLPIDKSVMYTN